MPSLVPMSLFLGALMGCATVARTEEVYCRFADGVGVGHYGRVEADRVRTLDAAPWAGGRETGESMALSNARLLAPSEPRNILCLANSYAGKEPSPPTFIRWFAKSPGAAAADGDTVEIPPLVDQLKSEVEVVIVIGRRLKNATEAEARSAIFGYTVGNEIFGFAESFQHVNHEDPDHPEVMLAAGLKLGDHFAPFGPFIHRGSAWPEARRTLTINGNVVYQNDTKGFLYRPEKAVSELSRVQTLEPGDVVFTGTTKSFVLNPGDDVVAEIEGLGRVRNHIAR